MKQIQLFTSLLDLQAAIEYEALRMSSLAQEQQPETAGRLQAQDSPEDTQQLLERFRHESVVIDSAEFVDSTARRRQKVAQAATG
jgi:hypothetical protein